MKTIELSDRDWESLLMATGYAAGAMLAVHRGLFYCCLELANAVNKDNPNWVPYEVPPREHHDDDNEELVRYFFEQMQNFYWSWLNERSPK